ncbi:MAG: hypothetical protein P4L43_02855 [Syntrophobacteraceae bacterium]|nr:hypothetical protein [Syntrophobacteraceae bacterium]
MVQAKFSIQETQARFLENFQEYGFKDKSAMLRAAIENYRKNLFLEGLQRSADLYCEIYEKDVELKELTESALAGWPE